MLEGRGTPVRQLLTKGRPLHLLHRIAAILSLALVALLGASLPAQAASPGQYRVSHDTGGLGGSVSIATEAGGVVRLAETQHRTTDRYGTNDARYVFAGGGYCVCEALYNANGDHAGNFNHGKGYASGTRFQLAGWTFNPTEGTERSELRIYRC